MKPILYYPLDSWFIKSREVRDRMFELNRTINWNQIDRRRAFWKLDKEMQRLELIPFRYGESIADLEK
jgi:isoleucyl-tRNA synthetase